MPRSLRSRLAAGAGALALLGGAMTMTAAPALADHGPSPSDSQQACTDAGGTFADLGGGVTTCTVIETDTRTVPGSDPEQKWTVELTDTTTTVYTTTVTQVEVTTLACINPGTQEVMAWSPEEPNRNPNCAEAYASEGWVQPGPPGFKIVEVTDYETVITHTKTSSTTTERTNCWNPGGQSQLLTHQHCQVEGVD